MDRMDRPKPPAMETVPEETRTPDAFLNAGASETGPCEEVSETILSKLYFYPDTVYKWYKKQTGYYGDLASNDARRIFYSEDFSWNNAVSPRVYTRLLGIAYSVSGAAAWTSLEAAHDFAIEMKHLKRLQTMSDRLLMGNVTASKLQQSVNLLLGALAHIKARNLVPVEKFQTTLAALYGTALSDLRAQLHRAGAFLPTDEADTVIDQLIGAVARSTYFNSFPQRELTVAVDCHTDNIVFTDTDEIVLIDSMFPNPGWRVIDELHTIARFATNVAVLGGTRQRDDVYEIYGGIPDDAHKAAALIHETRTALMQWSRRNLLNQPHLAEKFRVYAHEKLAELEVLRGK